MSIMMCHKKYVKVCADFDDCGNIIPKSITWDDDTVYEIDKIISVCRAASLKAGGAGIRYTIEVRGTTTFLFLEETRWFVEAKS